MSEFLIFAIIASAISFSSAYIVREKYEGISHPALIWFVFSSTSTLLIIALVTLFTLYRDDPSWILERRWEHIKLHSNDFYYFTLGSVFGLIFGKWAELTMHPDLLADESERRIHRNWGIFAVIILFLGSSDIGIQSLIKGISGITTPIGSIELEQARKDSKIDFELSLAHRTSTDRNQANSYVFRILVDMAELIDRDKNMSFMIRNQNSEISRKILFTSTNNSDELFFKYYISPVSLCMKNILVKTGSIDDIARSARKIANQLRLRLSSGNIVNKNQILLSDNEIEDIQIEIFHVMLDVLKENFLYDSEFRKFLTDSLKLGNIDPNFKHDCKKLAQIIWDFNQFSPVNIFISYNSEEDNKRYFINTDPFLEKTDYAANFQICSEEQPTKNAIIQFCNSVRDAFRTIRIDRPYLSLVISAIYDVLGDRRAALAHLDGWIRQFKQKFLENEELDLSNKEMAVGLWHKYRAMDYLIFLLINAADKELLVDKALEARNDLSKILLVRSGTDDFVSLTRKCNITKSFGVKNIESEKNAKHLIFHRIRTENQFAYTSVVLNRFAERYETMAGQSANKLLEINWICIIDQNDQLRSLLDAAASDTSGSIYLRQAIGAIEQIGSGQSHTSIMKDRAVKLLNLAIVAYDRSLQLTDALSIEAWSSWKRKEKLILDRLHLPQILRERPITKKNRSAANWHLKQLE